jgi:uncharacterized protein YegL
MENQTDTIKVNVPKTLDTHYLLILDRSGSMNSIWDETIGGLNSQIEQIKKLSEEFPEQNYFVSLIFFDHEINEAFWNIPAKDLKELDPKTFQPRGWTALHDAIGIGVNKLKAQLVEELQKETSSALVVIMTDGQENSSKEYDSSKLKDLITELQATNKWTITFMGASQDSVLTASQMGISAGNTLNYTATERGATRAYATMDAVLKKRAYSHAEGNSTVAMGSAALFSQTLGDIQTIGEDDKDGLDLNNLKNNLSGNQQVTN